MEKGDIQMNKGYKRVQKNFNKNGILRQKMIYKLIHLIQFPYLEIHQRVILPDQGDYILGSF